MSNSTLAPNSGASVPDLEVAGHGKKSLDDWRAQNKVDSAKQIKLVKLAHMRYQHPDLDRITEFLQGMYATD